MLPRAPSSSRWTVITLANDEDLSKMFLRLVDRINDAVTDSVDDAMSLGADAMREHIQQSGTGNIWDESWNDMDHGYAGRTQSYPGRVASGSMLDGVDSSSRRTGPNSYVGEFGWLVQAEDYWLSQEYGFTHNFTGQRIEGMYALADSADYAMKELDSMLDQRLRNV